MSSPVQALKENPFQVLIGGVSGAGKSTSARNIPNQHEWIYMNFDNKALPFKHKFKIANVDTIWKVYELIDFAKANPVKIKGIIFDTLTFMMDLAEKDIIRTATNTQAAWGVFADFTKNLFSQDYLGSLRIPVVFYSHIREDREEDSGEVVSYVPVKGSLKGNSIEAFFSSVIYTKKVKIRELDKYKSPILTITEDEQELGYKHVFQTRPTKDTVGSRIKTPMDMFPRSETFIDNDVSLLMRHLSAFYGVSLP